MIYKIKKKIESAEISLLISKFEVQKLISIQIDNGYRIHESPIESDDGHRLNDSSFIEWCRNSHEILKEVFSSEEVAKSFSAEPGFAVCTTLEQETGFMKTRLRRRVKHLEIISDSL